MDLVGLFQDVGIGKLYFCLGWHAVATPLSADIFLRACIYMCPVRMSIITPVSCASGPREETNLEHGEWGRTVTSNL